MSFLTDVVRWFGDAAHWQGVNGVPHRTVEHVVMSFAAVVTAAAIALPVGIVLGHVRRGGAVAINVSNVGRAIPSLAFLAVALSAFGIGARPAFVALFALALPPLMTNAYVGTAAVDDEVREVARGLGMNARQVLWHAELPVALPVILAGVRTAAVQVVATATLAALVTWGGLGRYIVDGLAQRDNVQVFAGAVLVAVLSVATEVVLALLQRMIVPGGVAHPESDKNVPFTGVEPVKS